MNTHQHILEKYNVSPNAHIGSGMEAAVYAYGADRVLKIYAGTATYADLITLQAFYNSLERRRVPYAFPQIHAVMQEDDHLVTVEQRLTGRPLASVLGHLNAKDLDAAMQTYLTAVLALANVKAPNDLTRLKLFDSMRASQTSDGDWHHFLQTCLNHKLTEIVPFLERDVARFAAKWEQLNAILASPYQGGYTLIHGDFCPANLLVDARNRATAVIDFGLFTMYGDHFFDVATSWVFFDMYDELDAGIYERFLAILLEAVGDDKRGILYRYILIYSILSTNTYSPTCADGHYQWCVANLNNQHYWRHVD